MICLLLKSLIHSALILVKVTQKREASALLRDVSSCVCIICIEIMPEMTTKFSIASSLQIYSVLEFNARYMKLYLSQTDWTLC